MSPYLGMYICVRAYAICIYIYIYIYRGLLDTPALPLLSVGSISRIGVHDYDRRRQVTQMEHCLFLFPTYVSLTVSFEYP
jgi:hypothetical protein